MTDLGVWLPIVAVVLALMYAVDHLLWAVEQLHRSRAQERLLNDLVAGINGEADPPFDWAQEGDL